MCLRAAADDGVLDHRVDSSVHDCHVSCHPLSHVWHHEVVRRESLHLECFFNLKVSEVSLFDHYMFWLFSISYSRPSLLSCFSLSLSLSSSTQVASVYFKDFHFLLVGIICLATSIEKWGLHRRIALRLVTMVGVDPAW